LLTTAVGGEQASALLSEAWRALGAPFASPASRAAALAIAESLIDQAEAAKFNSDRAKNERQLAAAAAKVEGDERSAGKAKGKSKKGKKEEEGDVEEEEEEHISVTLLRDHAPALLDSLQAALAARAARGRTSSQVGGSGGGVANRGATAGAMSGGAAGRELAVLKRLGPLLGQAAACAAIADTLIPVLAIRKLDELAVTEVLYAFASVMPQAGWCKLNPVFEEPGCSS